MSKDSQEEKNMQFKNNPKLLEKKNQSQTEPV